MRKFYCREIVYIREAVIEYFSQPLCSRAPKFILRKLFSGVFFILDAGQDLFPVVIVKLYVFFSIKSCRTIACNMPFLFENVTSKVRSPWKDNNTFPVQFIYLKNSLAKSIDSFDQYRWERIQTWQRGKCWNLLDFRWFSNCLISSTSFLNQCKCKRRLPNYYRRS